MIFALQDAMKLLETREDLFGAVGVGLLGDEVFGFVELDESEVQKTAEHRHHIPG